VADHDDLAPAAFDGSPHVVDTRTGSEPLVGLRLHIQGPPELVSGLACPEQWAREDDRRSGILVAEPLAEQACLFSSLLGQRAQLVGLPGSSFGMSDEVEAHRIARIAAWLASAT
jgi:hypothetical protein